IDGSISQGGAQQTIDIDLPAGLSSLNVTLGNASDFGADLDVFVYDCTAGPAACVLRGQGTGSTANESVTITTALNAGAWKAVIDPFGVPAGTTTFTYSDAFTRPTASAYGTLTTPANAPTARAAGATWDFDVTATANLEAGTGRFLRGTASVRLGSATGPVLGSAFVILETNP
ncbi:MAG TPA: serine protease, partial [Candidatus Binatia bacterium]|nr:serine protease [Candidatus Binatia bacterium]